MILHPLAQVAIFAFILSAVLSAKLPGVNSQYAYAIYLMSGMLAWSLFSEIVTRCLTLFIDNANLLKKIKFPRVSLVLIVSGSALVNNFLMFVAILAIFVVIGHIPSIFVIWLPLLMIVTMCFALGLGLILGVLNVFIRDIGQIAPVFLQFSFWLTPVVYMPAILPERYQSWLAINPMYHVVVEYQNILVFDQPPDWTSIAGVNMLTMVFLGIALILYRKASNEMVDVL